MFHFVRISHFFLFLEGKEKYRGMFEIQKSGDKTSSGEIGLDIRTHTGPEVGQDQVSGGVSVPCWHATPVADALWKPIFGEMSDSVLIKSGNNVTNLKIEKANINEYTPDIHLANTLFR